jgi:hypothetical protein
MPQPSRRPAFSNHVVGIVLQSSKKKVRRPNALAIVATMENPKAIRYGAAKHSEGKPMGIYVLAILAGLAVSRVG